MEDYLILLIVGISSIFISTLIFTNSLEFIGFKMKWAHSFTGGIIAPLVTSLPELTVFLVAVFMYKGTAGEQIGIGTILGQPFMASSVSYSLILIALIIALFMKTREKTELNVNKILAIPYAFILVFFPLILVPDLFRSILIKYAFSALFFFGYIYYLWLMYKKRIVEELEVVEEPYFSKFFKPKVAAAVQLALSVIGIYLGSDILVGSIEKVSYYTGISPLGTAIILVPVATAIPETMTAMIWAYQGKDMFAVSSLVGEKILYSTFYPALALMIVPWVLDVHAYLSIIATTVISLVYLYFIIKGKFPAYALSIGLIFFMAYVIMIFLHF